MVQPGAKWISSISTSFVSSLHSPRRPAPVLWCVTDRRHTNTKDRHGYAWETFAGLLPQLRNGSSPVAPVSVRLRILIVCPVCLANCRIPAQPRTLHGSCQNRSSLNLGWMDLHAGRGFGKGSLVSMRLLLQDACLTPQVDCLLRKFLGFVLFVWFPCARCRCSRVGVGSRLAKCRWRVLVRAGSLVHAVGGRC